MNKKVKDTFPNNDTEISCCPLCSSDEFLLSETRDVLICVDCGPVPIKNENSPSITSKLKINPISSTSILH